MAARFAELGDLRSGIQHPPSPQFSRYCSACQHLTRAQKRIRPLSWCPSHIQKPVAMLFFGHHAALEFSEDAVATAGDQVVLAITQAMRKNTEHARNYAPASADLS